jgi:hypothetical protein
MKMYGEVEVQLHDSWPRHWMEVSGQLHAPAVNAFTFLKQNSPITASNTYEGVAFSC